VFLLFVYLTYCQLCDRLKGTDYKGIKVPSIFNTFILEFHYSKIFICVCFVGALPIAIILRNPCNTYIVKNFCGSVHFKVIPLSILVCVIKKNQLTYIDGEENNNVCAILIQSIERTRFVRFVWSFCGKCYSNKLSFTFENFILHYFNGTPLKYTSGDIRNIVLYSLQ